MRGHARPARRGRRRRCSARCWRCCCRSAALRLALRRAAGPLPARLRDRRRRLRPPAARPAQAAAAQRRPQPRGAGPGRAACSTTSPAGSAPARGRCCSSSSCSAACRAAALRTAGGSGSQARTGRGSRRVAAEAGLLAGGAAGGHRRDRRSPSCRCSAEQRDRLHARCGSSRFEGSRAAGVEVGVGNREQQRSQLPPAGPLRRQGAGNGARFRPRPRRDELLRAVTAAPPAGYGRCPVGRNPVPQGKPDRPYRRVSAWIVADGGIGMTARRHPSWRSTS